MVLFSTTIEASWLKSFLRLYRAIEEYEFNWLFTDKHIEGRVMDPRRMRLLDFRIFPLDYYARDVPSKLWVRGIPDGFVDAIKRYRIRENVPLEVRDDGSLWVGGVQIGTPIKEEKEFPEELPKPQIIEQGFLRFVLKDFKHLVESNKGLAKPEDVKVGIKIEGREGVIIFFVDEEKFNRLDIKPYVPWLLEIGGSVASVYSFDFLNDSLVLGLSDTAKISIMTAHPCKVAYSGNFFDVDIYMANRDEEEIKTFKLLLEKKPPPRSLLFVLKDVGVLKDVIRATDPILRGAEVWFGINPYDFWFYWSFYDKGYFRLPKSVFEEFWAAASYAGSFDLSDLSSWFRDVETLECYLEGEPANIMLLVGKGEKIATKEMRSLEFKPALDVPDVKVLEVFKGQRDILADVFADAITAEDDFLIFIATPIVIKVIGRDKIYYRASLPIDAFQHILYVEEDYVPVSDRFLKPLGQFFTLFPGAIVSVGRPAGSFDIYVGGEPERGEYRALLAQTADEAERAILAYREEIKPPVAPPREEVKPIPLPPKRQDVIEILTIAPYSIMKHEDLVAALVQKNFDKSMSLDLIADMIKTGELYEPRPPYIRPTGLAVQVRILKDIPGIVGVDFHTYGPYRAGEVVWIPKENAEILIKQGIAESPKPQPPKLSLEEFSRIYNEKLDEWIKFGVEGRRSGLAGTLHYDAPAREKEMVARYTLETVRQMFREEIEKDIPVAYGSYETFYSRGAGDKFMEKWLPDRLHHFGSDLSEKTRRALEEEAKKPPPAPDIVKVAEDAIKFLEAL